MKGVHIEEKEDSYVLVFEMPGVREQDIIIKTENGSVNVIASTATVKTDTEEKKIEIDSVYYDKTVVLDDNLDFKSMKHIFFAGFLEIRIPKKE